MSDACVDDQTIDDADLLNRRVPGDNIFFDDNLNRHRPQSCAFDDNADGSWMSVHLQSRFSELSISATSLLDGHDGFGLVTLGARTLRDDQQGICRCHTEDEPAHAEVAGNKTSGRQKKWAKHATWVVNPKAPQ